MVPSCPPSKPVVAVLQLVFDGSQHCRAPALKTKCFIESSECDIGAGAKGPG